MANKIIGRCIQEADRGTLCGRAIPEDSNYESVGPNQLICEPCVDKLLSVVVQRETDSLGRINNGKGSGANPSTRGKAWRNYQQPLEKK